MLKFDQLELFVESSHEKKNLGKLEVIHIAKPTKIVKGANVNIVIKEHNVEPYEMYGKEYDFHHHIMGKVICMTDEGNPYLDFTGGRYSEIGIIKL